MKRGGFRISILWRGAFSREDGEKLLLVFLQQGWRLVSELLQGGDRV